MNILNVIKPSLGKMKVRAANITKAQISNFRISRFLNHRGGLDCFELTRLLLALNYKIVDKDGNTILGQPEMVDQQIKDNVLLPIETETTP